VNGADELGADRSARLARTVAKPPPYIDKIMQQKAMNKALLPE
jgi:hypothetical protein